MDCSGRQRTIRRPSEISEQEVMLPNLGGSGDAETKTKHQNLQGMEGGSEGIKSDYSTFGPSNHGPASHCTELWG